MAAASGKPSETSTDAERCGAKSRRTGKPCRNPRGLRTDHPGTGNCWLHGGASPNGRIHAAREQAARLGARLELEPHDALLDALYRQAAVVAYYAQRVAALNDDELLVEHRRERQAGDDGTSFVETSSDAATHVWVRVYEQAVQNQARLAKAAVDAGVAERHVRVIEAHAELFARALDGILGDPDLGLTAEQLGKAGPVVRRHLVVLEGGQAA